MFSLYSAIPIGQRPQGTAIRQHVATITGFEEPTLSVFDLVEMGENDFCESGDRIVAMAPTAPDQTLENVAA